MNSILDTLKKVADRLEIEISEWNYNPPLAKGNIVEAIQIQAEVQAHIQALSKSHIGTLGGVEDVHVLNTQTEVIDSPENSLAPNKHETLRLNNLYDLLMKGWIEESKNYIKDLLANDPSLGYQSGALPYLKAFEKAFWTACRKNNVIAAYMVLEQTRKADNTVTYKMITGGNHLAESVLSSYLQPLAKELGVNINPPKPYLEPGWIEKAATWNMEAMK